MLVATVANDAAGMGVDWNVSCSSPKCGSFNPTHTPSGAATTFLAPASVPVGSSVNITASPTADSTKAVTVTVAIIDGISVAFTSALPSSLPPTAPTALNATVNNDSLTLGVDWTVTCGVFDCGSFNPTHTASGVPTTYTAPASVPPSGAVTITATATADPTRSVVATVTIAAPISISLTQSPPSSLLTGGQAPVSATLTNDAASKGVDWTVTCGSASCGSFSSTHTASGVPTTFTAPASVPAGNTVTITATATADSTKNVAATVTITVPAISITFTQSPPSSLQTGAQTTVSATVANDSANLGVDWTVSCGSASCGSFNPTHTASGSSGTTSFTAPTSVPTGNNVTIVATATADTTKTAKVTVAIKSAGKASLLNGQYAFFLTGTNAHGFYAAAGSFTADGLGNITAGKEDFVDTVSAHPAGLVGGSYTIGNDGRGTMTITTTDSSLGVSGVQTLAFAVVSSQHALVIEFDSTATSSGSLDLQTSSSFSLGSISGGYSFTFSGVDLTKLPASVALDFGGVMTADGFGNFKSVAEDVNDGGTVTANTPTGTYIAPDSSGRGTATLGSSSTFVYYVVNSGTLKFIETDHNGLTAGSAFAQGTTPFSNASLSGSFAFTVAGKSAVGSLVAGGLFTSNGSGSITSGTMDVNNSGTVTNGTPSGTYTVASNGRGTLTVSPATGGVSQFAMYLTSSQGVLLFELDSGLTSTGAALAQSAGISATTFKGNYAGGFDATKSSGKEDVALQVASDGASALAGTADINQFGVSTPLAPGAALTGTFTASSNGRFTGTLVTSPTGTLQEIFYVLNSSTVLFIEADANGEATGSLQLQQFSSGVAISVAFTAAPPASLLTGATATISATVTNDSLNQGVDWNVSCGSASCGSFNLTHTASGVTTTFTAPATVPVGNTVTITATATADPTKTVTANVTITAPVSISITQAPPSSMQTGATAMLIATVTNDSANLGIDWAVTCGSVPNCGSFNPTHTTSGVTTTFTAPATVPVGNTVTITATATADATKTAMATVTITTSGSTISIALTQAPPSSLPAGTRAPVSATVTNDAANLGVDWTVTCGSVGVCGSFNPTHTQSGVTTTFTAPASIPTGNTVTIIATATADTSKTATVTVTITSAGRTGLLNGQYAFSFTGTTSTDNANGFYAAIGSLTADGNGNITAGEEDFVDIANPAPHSATLTGTYTIGNDGRGTVTLTSSDTGIGVVGKQTLSIAVVSPQHALVIAFDSSATSSGSLDLQTASNFSLSSISGGYSFIFSGFDVITPIPPAPFLPLNFGGVMTADGAGNFTNVVQDVNDGGTVTANSSPGPGTFTAPDSSGRGMATFGSFAAACSPPTAFVYYVVNSATLRFIETDNLCGITVGSAFAQGTAAFSNASLSGNFAFTLAGKTKAGAPLVAGGLFTSNGSGSITSGTMDVNSSGTVTSGTPSGTYAVASNGRGTLSFSSGTVGGLSQFATYLTSSQGVLLFDLNSNSTAGGSALAQSAGISAATFKGNYAGIIDAATKNGEEDLVAQVVSDGISTLTGTADINQFNPTLVTSTLTPAATLTGSFTAGSNGRFTGTLNTSATGTVAEIFYVVNGSTVLLIEADGNGEATGLMELQTF